MIRSAVLIQYTRVTDGQTDRQTELAWHIRAIAYMLLRVKIGPHLRELRGIIMRSGFFSRHSEIVDRLKYMCNEAVFCGLFVGLSVDQQIAQKSNECFFYC